MKKITLIFVLILFSHFAYSQSCLPYGIEFTNQSQIDSFTVDYPGCTDIEGDVLFNGSGIQNLTGLNVLNSIGGYLGFMLCDSLSSLNGMENLSSVGSLLGIIDCDLITSLEGFEGLISIGGSLRIENNDNLHSLNGLQNINSNTIGDLIIYGNNELVSCQIESLCGYLSSPGGVLDILNNGPGCDSPMDIADSCNIILPCLPFGNYYFSKQSEINNFHADFPNCTDLEGNVNISGYNIKNLDGLQPLTSVTGNLELYFCDSLLNIDGLENLNTIGNSFTISNCKTLTSIGGLNLSSVFSLYIYFDSSLVSLEGLKGIDSLTGNLLISNCNSLSSLAGFDSLTYVGGYFGIEDNSILASLEGSECIAFIEDIFIDNNDALSDLEGLEGLIEVGNDFFIRHNDMLSSLAGLSSLTTIDGDLEIAHNDSLVNLTGLNNLSNLGAVLMIHDNNNLVSLNGIESLDGISLDAISIHDNVGLSDCAVESICEFLAKPGSIAFVEDNTDGCNNAEEILEACAVGVDQLDGLAVGQLDISVYPNPAKGIVDFRISIFDFRFGRVTLKIYDVNGREKAVVFDGFKPAGEYTVPFDASALAPGVYFYRLTVDGLSASGKLIIMR